MKKILLGVLALALVVAVGLGLYAAYLVRSLETPEFKARVAEQASAAVGAKVQLASLDVTLLRGIRLAGIRIQNPPGFGGDLLAAESARLSYDPWSLLHGHIRVDELSLSKPVITLASDARGVFNYEKLSGLAPAPQKPAAGAGAASGLPRLVIDRLAVEGARFSVVDDKNVAAFRIEGASLESALAMEAGVLTGTGKARVDSVVLANALFLRSVQAPLKLTKERMSLAPLEARLGGGGVTGEIRVDFKPDMRYALQLAASGASVATLLKEAGSVGTLTGTLQAKAKIEGTGGVHDRQGRGPCRDQGLPMAEGPALRGPRRAPPDSRAGRSALRRLPRGVHAGRRTGANPGRQLQGAGPRAHRPGGHEPRDLGPRLRPQPRPVAWPPGQGARRHRRGRPSRRGPTASEPSPSRSRG